VLRLAPSTSTYEPGQALQTKRYIVRLDNDQLDKDDEERSIRHSNLQPLAVPLRLRGLSKDELNGRTGVLIQQSQTSAADRFIVRLDHGGKELSLKIDNVEQFLRHAATS